MTDIIIFLGFVLVWIGLTVVITLIINLIVTNQVNKKLIKENKLLKKRLKNG